MAENGTEEGSTPRPARRSGRSRKTIPLAESFKEYVETTPEDEVNDLTNQLQAALGSIANGPGKFIVTASCAARVETDDNSSPVGEQRKRSNSISNDSATRRLSSDEYYPAKSSSRRNSRAGSELAMSMKLSAQKALAELGEISDDEDEDFLQLGMLKEECVVGINDDSEH